MAHFAELIDGIVARVIVVSNADTASNGVEDGAIGAAFCHNLLGGEWLQTSYNNNIRKNYAGIGFTYDAVRDAFIAPKPYASWVLDEATCRWGAPVAMPSEGGRGRGTKTLRAGSRCKVPQVDSIRSRDRCFEVAGA